MVCVAKEVSVANAAMLAMQDTMEAWIDEQKVGTWEGTGGNWREQSLWVLVPIF